MKYSLYMKMCGCISYCTRIYANRNNMLDVRLCLVRLFPRNFIKDTAIIHASNIFFLDAAVHGPEEQVGCEPFENSSKPTEKVKGVAIPMQHTNAFLEGHFRMGRGSIHVPDVVEPLFIKLPDGSKRFGIRAMFCPVHAVDVKPKEWVWPPSPPSNIRKSGMDDPRRNKGPEDSVLQLPETHEGI